MTVNPEVMRFESHQDLNAHVVELVDTSDLGSDVEIRAGSSPVMSTKFISANIV